MAARAHAVPIGKFWENDWSLTFLLSFLVVSVFLVRPLEALGFDLHMIAAIAFTFILVTGILHVLHSRIGAVVFGLIAVATLVVHWSRYAIFGEAWIGIDAGSSLIACGVLAAIVLVQVFAEGPITSQRIQGAIAAYLLVALMFAAAYSWLNARVPDAFHGLAPFEEGHDPMQGFVYFSFVTLTTVGYGDVTPVHPVARSLAVAEALTGQLYPAILLARLVSLATGSGPSVPPPEPRG
jgi:hypothetical protein